MVRNDDIFRGARSFGTELDYFLDRICERINGFGRKVTALSDATDTGTGGTTIIGDKGTGGGGGISTTGSGLPLYNDSGHVFIKGMLVGKDAAGGLSPALAGSVRALFVATKLAAPGDYMEWSMQGLHLVRVEPGTTPVDGGQAWLSATTAGAVTPVQPAAAQMVGVFHSGLDASGVAQVFVVAQWLSTRAV